MLYKKKLCQLKIYSIEDGARKSSIKILNDEKKWFLETKNTAYVIEVDEDKNLQHLYWGEKFPYISDYPRALLQQDLPFDNFEQIIKEDFSPYISIKMEIKK